MSIEGIALEHFSALPKTGINSSTKSCPRHTVFHSFLSDDSKQDSATTNSYRNHLIEMIKEKVLTSSLSALWENTDGCVEQYICALIL